VTNVLERPDLIFLDGLDLFSGAVARLGASDWDRPSPCAGWRAVDVLGHVGAAVRFGTRLLEGALKEDQTWGISTWRQRLIHRLPAFVELAHRHDHLPALAETAEALHRRLTGRWVALAPMPTYPALR